MLRIDFLHRFALTFFIIQVRWFDKPATWNFSTPREDIAPPLLPLPCVSLKKQQYQKNGEKPLCFDNFTVLSLTFFQLNCHFGANARSMISQPTDQCSPRRHCCPLAFIKTERGGKKNGETTSCLDNFSVHSLTFFSIKLPFLGWTRDPWYCSPQTNFCPVATAALLSLLKQSREAKRMVRYGQEFSIFHFFNSPFFNLFAIFGANTWLVILQPTGWLLPHCHCHLDVFIKPEWWRKKWWEPMSIYNFTVC